MSEFANVNTDKEIWREIEGDYYAPSIHVHSSGKIGINVGGTVHIKDVRDWHNLAQEDWKSEEVTVDGTQASEQVEVDERDASPSVVEMLANLARRVTSLEQQLAATQRNLETFAEQTESNSEDIRTLDERTQYRTLAKEMARRLSR
ncbi:hypothetical protein COJ96_05855 [Bacillus sp. AFS073361]|uniref:hypothetical protein n=1 Tax=Bacillus sp. AFS073361 TaxID=2033511 RepID=UPI000BF93D0E|nr:hypothetical protein [Bacillus sp. AFS073361]PFP30235.1 hypothetical protein COJ96_05855 [Bacillus sp. AFS073361]